jgi:hypothetical protein
MVEIRPLVSRGMDKTDIESIRNAGAFFRASKKSLKNHRGQLEKTAPLADALVVGNEGASPPIFERDLGFRF